MRKKPHSIAFRVTDEQHKMIKEKAKNSNLSMTDFIVKCCFDKEIIIVNDVRELMKELHAVGRNLNQLMTEKMRFNKIIKKADLVKEISNHYFTGCYQVRNEWMVDRSNLVIAVFNGQKSGTKNTVDYAKRKGIRVVNVFK